MADPEHISTILARVIPKQFTREDLIGRRVRLVNTSDPYTSLRPGAEGVIDLIDSLGTYHITWDDGQSLGLVPGEDSFEVLP